MRGKVGYRFMLHTPEIAIFERQVPFPNIWLGIQVSMLNFNGVIYLHILCPQFHPQKTNLKKAGCVRCLVIFLNIGSEVFASKVDSTLGHKMPEMQCLGPSGLNLFWLNHFHGLACFLFFCEDEQIRMDWCVKDLGGINFLENFHKAQLFLYYCWWKKSCTSWLFTGFHTCWVVQDFFHQQYVDTVKLIDVKCQLYPLIAPTSCTLEEHPLFLNFMILSPKFPKSPKLSSKKRFHSSI